MSGYVILLQSDVDALMEEWGDLDTDPFWKPIPHVLTCRNQGAPFAEAPCGFTHEGPCTLTVHRAQRTHAETTRMIPTTE